MFDEHCLRRDRHLAPRAVRGLVLASNGRKMTCLSKTKTRVFDADAAASRLAQAWADGFVLDEFPGDEHPRSEADGYAVQRKLADVMGEPIGGYKLGLGSAAAMRRTGLGRPVWGFMTARSMLANGAALPAIVTGDFLVEVELAFVAKRRINPGETIADALSVWDAHIAIEIVRPRLANWTALGLPAFIADSVGFHAFVLGQRLPDDVVRHKAVPAAHLVKDGTIVAPAADESESAEPFSALDYFLNEAAVEGIILEKGAVVTTGNLVMPFTCGRGGRFSGSIGSSSVECSVEARSSYKR